MVRSEYGSSGSSSKAAKTPWQAAGICASVIISLLPTLTTTEATTPAAWVLPPLLRPLRHHTTTTTITALRPRQSSSRSLAMSTTTTTQESQVLPQILCVGIAAVDFIATVPHFPEPDEKMRSTSLVVEGGGNAANTACAMNLLLRRTAPTPSNSNTKEAPDATAETAGNRPTVRKEGTENRSGAGVVSLATAVGNDANGNTILEGLRIYGVDVDRHVQRYDGSSPFSYILSADVEGDSTRTIIHQPPPEECGLTVTFAESSIVPELPSQYDAVHFDCRHPEAAVYLSQKCREIKVPYSVDVERPREGLDGLLANASVVICNSDYIDIVLGKKEKEEKNEYEKKTSIASRLRQVMEEKAPRARLAVTTLGKRGSCLVRLGGGHHHDVGEVDEAGRKDGTNNEEEEKDVLLLKNGVPCAGAPKVSRTSGGDALWCDVWGQDDVGDTVIIDSTGAGDAYQGGFLAALWTYVATYCRPNKHKNGEAADGESRPSPTTSSADKVLSSLDDEVLAHALRVGTRVASEKLKQAGARKGLPRKDEDVAIQQEFGEMLSIPFIATSEKRPTTDVVSSPRK